MRLNALFALLACAACATPTHFVVSNDKVDLPEAQHDLNACRLDAAKSSDAEPLDSGILTKMSWQIHRTEITSLCLKDKGYSLAQMSGPCSLNCDGNTEIQAGATQR